MIEQKVVDAKNTLSALQAKQSSLIQERRSASFQVMRSSNAVIWEHAKQRYRNWLDKHGMRVFVLIGGLFGSLVLPFAFVAAILDHFALGIGVGLASALAAFAGYYIVLCGNDDLTKERTSYFNSIKINAKSRIDSLNEELQSVNKQIDETLSQLSVWEPELAKQRALDDEARRRNAFENLSKLLYEERWRELRGIDFENYVARVFQHLGYEVEETATTGDQGVDLIVIAETRRLAAQIKGYYHSVSNSAIQEVVAGMRFHRCTKTSVITNSKFTKSAIDLAAANNCTCVGEDNFEDFVYGRVFPRV